MNKRSSETNKRLSASWSADRLIESIQNFFVTDKQKKSVVAPSWQFIKSGGGGVKENILQFTQTI